jgi:ATP-dependent Clp protease protease subunit
MLFLEQSDPEAPIHFYINSPGGSVYAGLGIYDIMQHVTCPVYTYCVGMAASMGSLLLQAGEAGHRYALPHARIMIHQPLGGAQGQASDIEITAREIQKLKKELYDIISHHSGQTFERVQADSDRDYWMIAEEAKAYGMLDDVLIKPKKEEAK